MALPEAASFCLGDIHSSAIVRFWDFHCHNLSEASLSLKIHLVTLTPGMDQVERPQALNAGGSQITGNASIFYSVSFF